jgi:hypothetical protein
MEMDGMDGWGWRWDGADPGGEERGEREIGARRDGERCGDGCQALCAGGVPGAWIGEVPGAWISARSPKPPSHPAERQNLVVKLP